MSTTTNTWQNPDGTVLDVWAHPDGEAYLSAGLMARALASGGRVVRVHATLAVHGTSDPVAWPPSQLGPLRAQDLALALKPLGAPWRLRKERQVLSDLDSLPGHQAPLPTLSVAA